MRAWKWWGSFGRTVVRRLLGDPEEMNCVLVRCINNIIKPWNEVWALGKGSKDDFPQLKLMR